MMTIPDDLWLGLLLLAAGCVAWFPARAVWWRRGSLFLLLLLPARSYGTVQASAGPVCDLQFVYGSDIGGTGLLQGLPAGPNYHVGDLLGQSPLATNKWANMWIQWSTGQLIYNGYYALSAGYLETEMTVDDKGVYSATYYLGRTWQVSSLIPPATGGVGQPASSIPTERSTVTVTYVPGNDYVSITSDHGASGKIYFSYYVSGVPTSLVFQGIDEAGSAPSNLVCAAGNYVQWKIPTWGQYTAGLVRIYPSSIARPTTAPASTQGSVATQPSDFAEAATLFKVGTDSKAASQPTTQNDGGILGYAAKHRPNVPYMHTFEGTKYLYIPTRAQEAMEMMFSIIPSSATLNMPKFNGHYILGEESLLAYIFGAVDVLATGSSTSSAITFTNPLAALMPWIRDLVELAMVWVTLRFVMTRIVHSMGMVNNSHHIPPPLVMPGEGVA